MRGGPLGGRTRGCPPWEGIPGGKEGRERGLRGNGGTCERGKGGAVSKAWCVRATLRALVCSGCERGWLRCCGLPRVLPPCSWLAPLALPRWCQWKLLGKRCCCCPKASLQRSTTRAASQAPSPPRLALRWILQYPPLRLLHSRQHQRLALLRRPASNQHRWVARLSLCCPTPVRQGAVLLPTMWGSQWRGDVQGMRGFEVASPLQSMSGRALPC